MKFRSFGASMISAAPTQKIPTKAGTNKIYTKYKQAKIKHNISRQISMQIRKLFFLNFQAMHFFYGLGAFISPMIAAPFLVNIDCTPLVDGVTSSSNSLRITRAQHLSKSRTAFVILGSIQVSNSHVIL